ncbi:DNA cytosine methyltransferase [Maridesulfovibrio bastinii]|uniref:DNA cytosine methyltransferase n=1 Tax=Maridesulfovibrio bastinii TaxID=47157 RepID=UPI00041000DF|nr:DNA (cytosine-5-)-methyltransferase [Maridesulfovibrio bastinii]
MKVGSLFSGVGLTDFGLELAGFEHAWFCEIEPYAQNILSKRWPGKQIYKDIKELDGNDVEKVDLLSGGFPCQDVSCGGKRKGITKETRSGLWYEYARIIRQILPKYVLIENVPGLRSKGFDIVLKELAKIGYDAEWIVLSAAQFGAPHLRERLFVVAYPHSYGDDNTTGTRRIFTEARINAVNFQLNSKASWNNLQIDRTTPEKICKAYPGPIIHRMDDGGADWLDRLKALGNGITPQQAHFVGSLILDHDFNILNLLTNE